MSRRCMFPPIPPKALLGPHADDTESALPLRVRSMNENGVENLHVENSH